MRHSPVYGRSRPNHAVSEELLALAEDKRPEANRLIELRAYASQRHNKDVSQSSLGKYQLGAD